MKEFSYLSLYTEYSMSGSVDAGMRATVCFGNAFRSLSKDSDITYNIRVYPGAFLCLNKRRNNACFLNVKEIGNHLRQLKGIFPFEYKVSETRNEENIPCYLVTMHIKDSPVLFHKYALTWLRYVYEYPYNVILKDAYRLKKDPVFLFTSIATLFNVVSNCYDHGVDETHSISENHTHIPLKKKELRERIKKVKCLEKIYNHLRVEKEYLPYKLEKYKSYDLEYWSDELFDKRKPFYMKMYNKIKN